VVRSEPAEPPREETASQEVLSVPLEIAPFAAKLLAEHEIQILYRIDGLEIGPGPNTTLSDLADGPGIATDQVPALEGRLADTKVWKPATSSDAGQDFHRHIREIVGGRREDLATRWILDDGARRLLDRADLYEQEVDPGLRVTKRMALMLTDAANARLGRHGIACDGLLVRISGITLTLFKTGHGFAVTVVELVRSDGGPLSALELLEAQVLLARFGKLVWTDTRNGDIVPGDPFLLSDLVHRLACGMDKLSHVTQRVATYTYAQLAEPSPTELRDLFAQHLARHYTTDYAIAPDIKSVAFVADFETVRHAVALEGAATIVGATPERPELPAFLRDFRTATFRRHYVPIALLARHEHAFLVERTTASVLSRDDMADEQRAVTQLKRLRAATLTFRLCYRFSELSFVSMHNALNLAFREILHLDRLMQDLGADVANAETYLREVHEAEERRVERQKHQRYYWVTVIGGAALAGLTTYTIGKELGELGVHALARLLGRKELTSFDELIPGGIGVILGLGVAYLAVQLGYRRGPSWQEDEREDEHGGHLTLHAMLDHMIHAAIKK
jgi:hypothetical protein